MKRILSMLLCLALLLSITACGAKPAPETDLPGETNSDSVSAPEIEETPEPEPTAEEIYANAVASVEEMNSMRLDIKIRHQRDIGTDTFAESSDDNLILNNLSNEDFSASLTRMTSFVNGHERTFSARREIFSEGTIYAEIDNFKAIDTCSKDEFLARMTPAILLDASLYQTISQNEANVIQFSDANAIEHWLHAEDAELLSANGSAQLDENGMLQESSYEISYQQGPVTHTITATCTIKSETEEIKIPDNAEQYADIGDLDILYAIDDARCYLSCAAELSSDTIHSINTAAGMATRVETRKLHTSGVEEDLIAQIDTEIQFNQQYYGTSETNYITETYADRNYTYELAGEEPTNDSLSPYSMRHYCDEISTAAFPELNMVQDLTVKDMDDFYLLEYTCNDEYATSFGHEASYMFYNDELYLDNLASNYRTDLSTGFLSIDKTTGFPLAVNYTYCGTHTIDGIEYALTYECVHSYAFASPTTYKELTDELPITGTPASDPTPLFYHVTGENGQEMWLLGTIHVGDERTTRLPEEILNAFDAADSLAVEFDINAFTDQLEEDETLAAQVATTYLYLDGSATINHIQDEATYEKALDYMKASGNYTAAMLVMKPSIWANTIDNFYLQLGYKLSGDFGVDSQLLDRAEETGKPIQNVESGISQIQMMTGYSDALQELLLRESMAVTAQETNTETENLYELWCSGDEAALIAEIQEEDTSDMTEEELALYEEYENAMLTERDAEMLQVAQGYLESGEVVFYAVGLAHLLSESGLVNALREAGYTVELVSYN